MVQYEKRKPHTSILLTNSPIESLIKSRFFSMRASKISVIVNEIRKFIKHDGSRKAILIERLLFAAMIEARSCERFKVLATHISDNELAEFYKELMISEANHYTLFIKWAKEIAKDTNIDVDKRWKEYLEYEASIITQYGKKQEIHG